MYREPRDDSLHHLSPEMPSPGLRERVLRRCRLEMLERCQMERRRRTRWRWSLAGGVICLLLVNAAAEQRTEARIAGLVQGHVLVAKVRQQSPGPARSSCARMVLLAALLRDPNSL